MENKESNLFDEITSEKISKITKSLTEKFEEKKMLKLSEMRTELSGSLFENMDDLEESLFNTFGRTNVAKHENTGKYHAYHSSSEKLGAYKGMKFHKQGHDTFEGAKQHAKKLSGKEINYGVNFYGKKSKNSNKFQTDVSKFHKVM